MINNYIPTLKYGPEDKIAPIPPQEAAVQTVTAEPWLKVEQTCFSDLEGTNFDREGYFWFVAKDIDQDLPCLQGSVC